MMQTSAERVALPVGERDHILGPSTAPATLLEYGDYECPYCGQAHQVIKELYRQMARHMRFVFRHFPLTMIHPHAQHAAESAEAAGSQGKFWEMHDVLYENQQALDDRDLAMYAATIGLDVSQFVDELARHVHAPKVRADFMSGVRSGVNGTPTFFINGKRHDGSYDFDTLFLAVEEAIKTSTARR
jgi:protein-disulfide isomerase